MMPNEPVAIFDAPTCTRNTLNLTLITTTNKCGIV